MQRLFLCLWQLRLNLTSLPCFAMLGLCVWTASANAEWTVREIAAHDEYVYMIDFSASGKRMVSAAGDNQVLVWDVATEKPVHALPHDSAVYAAVIHPHEKLLATGSGEGHARLWNLETGEQVFHQQAHDDAIYCLAFSTDGKRLATVGGDAEKGDTDLRIWQVEDDACRVISTQPGHQRPAYGVLFLSNGQLVTSGGDGKLRWHDAEGKFQQAISVHDSDVYRCAVTQDGKWFATTSQDKSIRLWSRSDSPDAGNLIEKDRQTLKDPMYAVAFHPTKQQLASVGDDGRLRLWNTADGQLILLHQQKLSREALYAVAFSPDGSQLVAAGTDGKIYQADVSQ
ncbi:MAG: WD40 repeat domain-containing protein [Planctomycetales bacterium]|nr:WD40 repeat domain-containing protein [Planctomycetales bacterium]